MKEAEATPSKAPPERTLRLLFIHHSCGGQLLASPGPDTGANCIYQSHPNGGGLRAKLEQNSYEVHEASYNSVIGQRTDIFDWLPKFRDQMEMTLTCDSQDKKYPDNRRNEIVVFKSCFPNNDFCSEGSEPGNPTGPELTVWNAKAAYSAILGELQKWPTVLFVCVTAPPLAPKVGQIQLWKQLVKRWLRHKPPLPKHDRTLSASLARQFNDWLAEPSGWLRARNIPNVVVFDYFDLLTAHGSSNFSVFATGNGCDSHPSRAGNERAADRFVPFLNQAVRCAGLSR